MVRNTMKKAEDKAREIQEMEVQLDNSFYCGSCSIGFQTIEEYTEHCNEEEHNYHITRRIEALVPGLGFCPACSCLVQTYKGWESHVQSAKHAKCIESLNAIGIHGEYGRPLGCSKPGQLGLPIEASQIDQKTYASYGYGHGGKLGKNVPLIGLNHVTELEVVDKDDMPKYHCGICDINFTFEHRGKHLTGMDHRSKYLENNYEAWYRDLLSMNSDWKTRKLFRLMWYAHQVEQLERDSETETAKQLRNRFVNEVTQKKQSNKQKQAMKMSDSHRNRGGMRGGMMDRGRPPFRGDHITMTRGRGGPSRGRPGHMMRPPSRFGPPRRPPPFSTLPMSTLPPRGPCGTGPRRLLSHGGPFSIENGSFAGGYCGDLDQSMSLGKRPTNNINVTSKRLKEDPYAVAGATNQLDVGDDEIWDESYDPYEEPENQDYTKALEAIEVLESFAMSKAQQSIKDKIESMKNAVLSESGVSVESLKGMRGGRSRPRGSRGLPRFPPRPVMGSGPTIRMFRPRGPPSDTRPMRPPSSWQGMRSRGRGMRPPMNY